MAKTEMSQIEKIVWGKPASGANGKVIHHAFLGNDNISLCGGITRANYKFVQWSGQKKCHLCLKIIKTYSDIQNYNGHKEVRTFRT